MSMLKSFSPLLGNFRGTGMNKDGTNMVGRLKGYEIIENSCYGIRLELFDEDSKMRLSNAFFLLSLDEQGLVQMTVSDSNMHTCFLHWESSSRMAPANSEKRIFMFNGVRDRKAPLQFVFEITSAEEFTLLCSSNSSQEKIVRQIWSVQLNRMYERDSLSGQILSKVA